MGNIIHEKDGKWYFWEETWSRRQGPFDSHEEANWWLDVYCWWLDTGLIIF